MFPSPSYTRQRLRNGKYGRLIIVVLALMALLGVMAGTSGAAAGETTRVSVSSSGTQGNDDSYGGSFSTDGRYVAFYSYATDLVTDDTNDFADNFMQELVYV